VAVGARTSAIAAGDVDGDGRIDLAVLDTAGRVHVLLNRP